MVAPFWGEQQATVAVVAVACIFSELRSSMGLRLDGAVAKYWETIVEKLKSAGWEVRWIEAMHDGEPGWTVTATRGKERHSSHANDLTLAFQELEANCAMTTKSLSAGVIVRRSVTPRRPRLTL